MFALRTKRNDMVLTTSLTHYRALKAKGVAVQLVTLNDLKG